MVPLNPGQGGPGNWKYVSVSSLTGVPQLDGTKTQQGYTCLDEKNRLVLGRYATTGGNDYLVVPIQLPHGATIFSLTGVMCDLVPVAATTIHLYRSLAGTAGEIAMVATTNSENSAYAFTKTTTSIANGMEVVDNTKYSYFVYMSVDSSYGANLMPVSAMVTLK